MSDEIEWLLGVCKAATPGPWTRLLPHHPDDVRAGMTRFLANGEVSDE